MTTTLEQFETWVSTEWQALEGTFKSDEEAVMAFLAPLGQQILNTAEALGKATVQDGLKVIVDASKQAVEAGAVAAASGQDAVAAAEETFISVGASEGLVAVKNAEAGAIKAAVAIAQSAVQSIPETV